MIFVFPSGFPPRPAILASSKTGQEKIMADKASMTSPKTLNFFLPSSRRKAESRLISHVSNNLDAGFHWRDGFDDIPKLCSLTNESPIGIQ